MTELHPQVAELLNAKSCILHEVTRKHDLDMNDRDLRADEAYFASALAAWNKMRHGIAADTAIGIFVGGYDDDPREIWEIPEVVAFMARWIRESGAMKERRLSPTTRAVLAKIEESAAPVQGH